MACIKQMFYHYDMRGSVSNILSTKKNSGNITLVQTYDYDAFGNAKEGINQSVFKNDIQFTCAVNDKASGLLYLNARHYNPKTGRFMQKDTYRGQAGNPGSHHTYAYCSNNPVNMVDPTGHATYKITNSIPSYPVINDDISNGNTKPTIGDYEVLKQINAISIGGSIVAG